jgi:hypothetical protein
MEARYGRRHNLGMAIVAVAMVGASILYFGREYPGRGSAPGLANPVSVLYLAIAVAMAFYAWLGFSRFSDRAPQVVIDRDGIVLGFGRNRRFAWDQIEWVRLHRLGLRPALHLGLAPDAFVAADLRLSMWHLDDGLKPVRGMPAVVAVRDNGLDTRAAAMLDAVKSFRPNLVRP